MAYIEDRWFCTVTRPDGTRGREQSVRHGTGRRWRVRYRNPDNRERAKSFDRKVDAETFHALKERARIRADLLTADSDGIDPGGYYVYLLWEVQDDGKPVYVGSSGNILGRLGAHLSDTGKRPQIGWITLIRCTSERAMLDRENVLIRRYRPPWNKKITLENGRIVRNPEASESRNPEASESLVPQEELAAEKAWQQLKASVRRAAEKAR